MANEIKNNNTDLMVQEDQNQDSLTFDDSVIEKIVAITVKDVDGIIEMKGGILSAIQEGFGGTNLTKGVDVEVEEQDAEIDLAIIMEYGKSAPKIFNNLKKVIEQNVQEMTGLGVSSLNVRVVDVMTKAEYAKRQSQQESQENQGQKQGNARF